MGLKKVVKARLHRIFKGTIFVSGTFDIFNGLCKQHHGSALNPFLNGAKNGGIDGTCKRSLIHTRQVSCRWKYASHLWFYCSLMSMKK